MNLGTKSIIPTPPIYISLVSLARQALKENGGDAARAAASLVARLKRDSGLLSAVVMEAIEASVYRFTQEEVRRERSVVVNTVNKESVIPLTPKGTQTQPIGGYGAVAGAAIRNAAKSILDTPGRNGKLWRYYKNEDFEIDISTYRNQSTDQFIKYKFLEKLNGLTPEGRKCGEVISDNDANFLWTKIKMETEQALNRV